MVKTRDPRLDPRAGDILDLYGSKTSVIFVGTDGILIQPYPRHGARYEVDRETWIELMADATIFKRGPE